VDALAAPHQSVATRIQVVLLLVPQIPVVLPRAVTAVEMETVAAKQSIQDVPLHAVTVAAKLPIQDVLLLVETVAATTIAVVVT
jgi:hypothetical protein